jgi:hypothetical protein
MDYTFNPRHNRKNAVTAPTSRGIVLFRTLIDDERHLGEIDAAPWRLNALQSRLNQGKKETS